MALLLAALLLPVVPAAANYVTLSDRYTADPAPFVHEGRLYIYTSHDLALQTEWAMTDYSLMSTTDLRNWQDHGIVFDINNQTWGKYAWAQQVLAGSDGKFYMYYPGMQARPGSRLSGIGVAVSDSIAGPFNDVLGHPLLPGGSDDPTVFRDDDGQVYFCANYGGPLCAKLMPNLTALATPPALLSPPLPNWFEAPWLSKWKGTYYLSYMCKGNGQTNYSHYGWDICYGSCSGPQCSPLGPYTFRGTLMWNPPNDCGPVNASCADPRNATGENNHQGIVEFPANSGHLYMAYHSRTLSKSRGAYLGYQRNVALDRLYARGDGSTLPLPPGLPWVAGDGAPGAGPGLLPVTATPSWTRQLAYLNPYATTSALLSSAMSQGLGSEPCAEGGLNLGFSSPGAYLEVSGVDFGSVAPTAVLLRYATPQSGGRLQVSVAGGAVLADCALPSTGGWQVYQNTTCALSRGITGIAAVLRLTFVGGAAGAGVANLRYYAFAGPGVGVGGGVPPPPSITLRLRAAGTGLYWGSPSAASGAIAPTAPQPLAALYTLRDMEDGSYTLSAVALGAGLRYVVVGAGGGVVGAGLDAADPAARFFLYGTTTGSFGLLSASTGLFVGVAAGGEGLQAAASDPRAGGGSVWPGRLGGGGGLRGKRNSAETIRGSCIQAAGCCSHR